MPKPTNEPEQTATGESSFPGAEAHKMAAACAIAYAEATTLEERRRAAQWIYGLGAPVGRTHALLEQRNAAVAALRALLQMHDPTCCCGGNDPEDPCERCVIDAALRLCGEEVGA